tara:strand:- start:490 stop:681 length:192 start_codon:yes stop_codon:yes gene_type:complete
MAHYTHLKRRAIETANRFNKESDTIYKVWEFPNARVWKWFVATEEEYNQELILIERRKNKTKK